MKPREKLITKLMQNQDLNYKKFNEKICPTSYEMIGVRMPIIKQIAKQYTKEYGINIIEKLSNQYYEEVLIKGLIIGYANTDIKITQEYIKKFVPLIDNWGICDTTISNMKFIKNNLEEYFDFFINNYYNSQNPYELRFMLVALLTYYINSAYIDQILNLIDNIKSEEYYVNMAIAWLISIAYIKEKEKTEHYLNNNNLNKFTYNKAIQKICESLRVTNEEKELLKKKKRK